MEIVRGPVRKAVHGPGPWGEGGGGGVPWTGGQCFRVTPWSNILILRSTDET